MDITQLGDHVLNPETLGISYGYDPKLSEGAIKPPVFLTSTFQFKCAEDGKRFFEVAYGLREKQPDEALGLIYSRINNPNLQIFEERMALWDGSERALVFSSGMSAIATALLALLKPGDALITTNPVYGGTHYLFTHILPSFKIDVAFVDPCENLGEQIRQKAKELGEDRVRVLYMETPANPSNWLIDIEEVASVAKAMSKPDRPVLTMVDNTFLGPVFQRPIQHGADLCVYSATKFIGGHSDLVAGIVTGKKETVEAIAVYRTILGTAVPPFTGWMLLRSLETLSVRMRRQSKTARKIARALSEHPKVKAVYYPGLLKAGTTQHKIYKKQCLGPGSLISFEIDGGEAEAFKVLNQFKICKLAVSLGGTESLVEHPMTMTHSDVPRGELEAIGVRPGLIRMSVGIEHDEDLLFDLRQALAVLD